MIKLDDYSRGQRDLLLAFLEHFEQQGEQAIEIERFRSLVKGYIDLLEKKFKEEKDNAGEKG